MRGTVQRHRWRWDRQLLWLKIHSLSRGITVGGKKKKEDAVRLRPEVALHPHYFPTSSSTHNTVKTHWRMFPLFLNTLSISSLCSVTLTCSMWYLPSPSERLSRYTHSLRALFHPLAAPSIIQYVHFLGEHNNTLAWSGFLPSLTPVNSELRGVSWLQLHSLW